MDIAIDYLYPSASAMPENAVDAYGQAYTAWALNDEAQFSFVIPTGYTAGTMITLTIKESSVSTYKKHKWECEIVSENSAVDTVSEEFTSNALSLRVSTRTIDLFDTGLNAGSAITVILKRIAASGDEDSNPIRVFDLVVYAETREALSGITCTGRVGEIIAKVLIATNDANQEFIDSAECLLWINECQRDISRNGYFEKYSSIDSVADQEDYNLPALLSDFVMLRGVRWSNGDKYGQIKPISSRGRYEEIKEDYQYSGGDYRPYYYFFRSGLLSLYPVPTESVVDAIKISYNYCPSDLGCTSNTDPYTPEAFDEMYVNWCVRQAMQKDYTRGYAGDNFKRAYAQYRDLMTNLLWQHRNVTSRGMAPYR